MTETKTVGMLSDAAEGWKEVVGPEGDRLGYPYEVSVDGRVRRIVEDHLTEKVVRPVEPFAQDGNDQGYLRVDLRAPGKPRKLVYVHQLVAWAHVPGGGVTKHVDHRNGNHRDNRADNLRFVRPDRDHRGDIA